MKEMMGRLGITGFSLVFVASLVGYAILYSNTILTHGRSATEEEACIADSHLYCFGLPTA